MRRSACLLVLTSLVACSSAAGAPARGGGGSPLDGTWKFTWNRSEQIRAGITLASADYWAGPILTMCCNGRFEGSNLRNGHAAHRTFTVRDDLVTIVFAPGPGVTSGEAFQMRFSVFRDRLTWLLVPGRAGQDGLPAEP